MDNLSAPDVINPNATVVLLASTGVTPDCRLGDLLAELADLAERHGPAGAADRFLAPGHDDGPHRWVAFVAAHTYDGDAVETLRRPEWIVTAAQRGRPLTATEAALCRVAVNRWDRRSDVTPTQYALAEASATSGELSKLTIGAVTVTGPVHVALPGGRDQDPRTVTLDDWQADIVLARLTALAGRDRSEAFVYDGTDPGTAKAQASASGNLKRVLWVAGLAGDPSLNPTSVRNTCAQRRRDRGERLEDIAAVMGARSLDRLVALLAQ
jgi:hypothetical protein